MKEENEKRELLIKTIGSKVNLLVCNFFEVEGIIQKVNEQTINFF